MKKQIIYAYLTFLVLLSCRTNPKDMEQSDLNMICTEVLKRCIDVPCFDYVKLYIKDFNYIISISKDLEKTGDHSPDMYEGVNFDSLKTAIQFQTSFDTIHIKSWEGTKVYLSSRSEIIEGSIFWRKFSENYLNGDVRIDISSFIFSKPYINCSSHHCKILLELYLKWDSSLNKACIVVETDLDYKIKKINCYKLKNPKALPPKYPGSYELF